MLPNCLTIGRHRCLILVILRLPPSYVRYSRHRFFAVPCNSSIENHSRTIILSAVVYVLLMQMSSSLHQRQREKSGRRGRFPAWVASRKGKMALNRCLFLFELHVSVFFFKHLRSALLPLLHASPRALPTFAPTEGWY
jgi:hypothetical protein